MKTFQKFSNVWQDSDEEKQNNDQDEDSSSSESSDSDSSDTDGPDDTIDTEADTDDNNEVSSGKRKIDELNKKLDKTIGTIENKINIIQRYDPTAEDQEKFTRNDDKIVSDVPDATDDQKTKSFNIKSDLKSSFGGDNKSSSGFSFGFLGGTPAEDEKNDVKLVADYASDSDNEVIPAKKLTKMDIGARFGMQLKGKGTSAPSKSFFFTAEDPRLEDGLVFFFDHKVDIDEVRAKYNEKRPILSEILKKKLRNKQKLAEAKKGKQNSWKSDKSKFKKRFSKSKQK